MEAVSLLIIRAHKRFAVCRKVRLRPDKGRELDGLLIELSLDGCRISRVPGPARLAPGDAIAIRIADGEPLGARIRWLRDDAIGLRFDRPLHTVCLQALIRLCRPDDTATAAA